MSGEAEPGTRVRVTEEAAVTLILTGVCCVRSGDMGEQGPHAAEVVQTHHVLIKYFVDGFWEMLRQAITLVIDCSSSGS